MAPRSGVRLHAHRAHHAGSSPSGCGHHPPTEVAALLLCCCPRPRRQNQARGSPSGPAWAARLSWFHLTAGEATTCAARHPSSAGEFQPPLGVPALCPPLVVALVWLTLLPLRRNQSDSRESKIGNLWSCAGLTDGGMVTWLPSDPPLAPAEGVGPEVPEPPSAGNGPVPPGPPIVETGPEPPAPGPPRLVVGASSNEDVRLGASKAPKWSSLPKPFPAPPNAEPPP